MRKCYFTEFRAKYCIVGQDLRITTSRKEGSFFRKSNDPIPDLVLTPTSLQLEDNLGIDDYGEKENMATVSLIGWWGWKKGSILRFLKSCLPYNVVYVLANGCFIFGIEILPFGNLTLDFTHVFK